MLTKRTVLRRDMLPDQELGGVAVPLLCGAAHLCVGWAFAYLDRRLGRFGVEAALWAMWSLTGFALGAATLRGRGRAAGAGKVLTVIACCLAVFPGFLMFTLVRWMGFAVLLVLPARAAVMRTRRDFYYCLLPTVAVSLLVATHSNADWTLWFYLAPAWMFLALALAWDYASGVRLGGLQKTGLTLGFIAGCVALSSVIFALAPQPNILGFGFLPPGTDAPGRFSLESGRGGGDGPRGEQGGGETAGSGRGSAGGGADSALAQAISRMRQALTDPAVPRWQRGAIEAALAASEALLQAQRPGDALMMTRQLTPAEKAALAERVATVLFILRVLALLVFLAVLAFVAWLLRWRVGVAAALSAAWVLARWRPAASMHCCAYAIRWMLRRAGHPIQPGQSVMEHVASAALPGTAGSWLRAATRLYCEQRFGGMPASVQRARHMHRASGASAELLRGRSINMGRKT